MIKDGIKNLVIIFGVTVEKSRRTFANPFQDKKGGMLITSLHINLGSDDQSD